jgi:succinate-semialdehyde dehydrogenase/glutarate-semialdehyde dehydrogenase
MVNDHLMSHGLAETPWVGFGASGMGRTHGETGFHEMLKTKVIVDDFMPGVKSDIFWHPYSEKVYRGMHAVTELMAGPGLFRRIKAIPRVLGIFMRYWRG